MTSQDHAVQNPCIWITLLDALNYIRKATSCWYVEAQVWLKDAIGSATIAVKWGDSRGPNDKINIKYLRGSQLVLAEPGLAFDPESGRLRPLLVLRLKIMSLDWSSADAATHGTSFT